MSLEDIIQQVRDNLGKDYIAGGIIGLNGLHVLFDCAQRDFEEEKFAVEFADIVKEVIVMVKEANVGNLNYTAVATDQCKIFLTPIWGGGNKYFSILIIRADGNMGRTIMELEKIKGALGKVLS